MLFRTLILLPCIHSHGAMAALGDASLLGSGGRGDVTLVQRGVAAPIHVSAADWPGVRRDARDLANDIQKVTGTSPALASTAPGRARTVILVGTLGRSALIDDLVARNKLDVTGVAGRWESFVITTKDSPVLEYRMYLHTSAPVEVTAITAPTLNFVPDRGLRYAASIDDEPAQIVTPVPQDYQAGNRNVSSEKLVGDNAHYGRSLHSATAPGYHTLKIWLVDRAVVMQKLLVDLGGLRPSYLGPPESFHILAR